MVNMDTMPLRWGHYRVLITASIGQVLGAGLATLVGIILPMIQIVRHPELTSLEQGLIGCTSLVGITIGSFFFGRLSDKYGYLFFFRLCPFIVFLASLLVYFTADMTWLVVGLFIMGFGIGGGYSLDSDYISEIMPMRWRLFMVGVAKASSSLGNIGVAVICFFLLRQWRDPAMWNSLVLIISVLTLLMCISRIWSKQSAGWLMAHNKPKEAEAVVQRLLGNDVQVIEEGGDTPITENVKMKHHIGPDMEVGEIRNRKQNANTEKVSVGSLFRGKNLKRVIFSGVPWACEGLGVYGIGVFLPILVLALGLDHAATNAHLTGTIEAIDRITNSVQITAWINFFILPGFVLGLLLINKIYHVSIQVWGFILCAVGLLILLIAYECSFPVWIAIAGFMIFELFLNAGPHLMTFILPSQIYPVADRGEGAGIAAAIGKIGAVLGVLFIPMLLDWGGVELVLIVSIIVQLIGASVTSIFGKDVLPKNKQKQTGIN